MYGYSPIYVGGPQPGALPSEAEFVLHANKLASSAAKEGSMGKGTWYMLLAKRIAEGQSDLSFNTTEVSRDLVSMRRMFRLLTEGRSDGGPLFGFAALYTFDGPKIVDSLWWADARYVVTMDSAPATDADRAARAALASR